MRKANKCTGIIIGFCPYMPTPQPVRADSSDSCPPSRFLYLRQEIKNPNPMG